MLIFCIADRFMTDTERAKLATVIFYKSHRAHKELADSGNKITFASI